MYTRTRKPQDKHPGWETHDRYYTLQITILSALVAIAALTLLYIAAHLTHFVLYFMISAIVVAYFWGLIQDCKNTDHNRIRRHHNMKGMK